MGTDEDRRPEAQEAVILRQAVENTNEAFVTIDENHKVLFFNRAAEELFGFAREEVLGRDLDVIMSPGCSRDHRGAVKRYVESRVPRRIGHESEIMVTRKGGEVFPASISFSVTEVKGGLFFTGIVRDLTETRALQEQVLKSERLAALGQLVAEISHEIKNPLMMIGGFARQLIRKNRDEQDLNKLHVIAEEVERLENLLSDLRGYYLPREMVKEPVDLKALLEEVLSLSAEDIEKTGIETHLDIEEKAATVVGDEKRLKQVFLNLIKNAMEAMDEGGHLWVATKRVDGQVEIRLRDSGSGISEADRDRIFDPFFSTKAHGTGLGLCVSKRIIEEHENSALSIESKEGEGTTFKIILPRYQENA